LPPDKPLPHKTILHVLPSGLLQNRKAEEPPHKMLGRIDIPGPHIVAKLIFGSILKQPARAVNRSSCQRAGMHFSMRRELGRIQSVTQEAA